MPGSCATQGNLPLCFLASQVQIVTQTTSSKCCGSKLSPEEQKVLSMMALNGSNSIGLLSRPQRAPECDEDKRNVEMGVHNAAFGFVSPKHEWFIMRCQKWHVQAAILQEDDTLSV